MRGVIGELEGEAGAWSYEEKIGGKFVRELEIVAEGSPVVVGLSRARIRCE